MSPKGKKHIPYLAAGPKESGPSCCPPLFSGETLMSASQLRVSATTEGPLGCDHEDVELTAKGCRKSLSNLCYEDVGKLVIFAQQLLNSCTFWLLPELLDRCRIIKLDVLDQFGLILPKKIDNWLCCHQLMSLAKVRLLGEPIQNGCA
uniref:SCAN box domain-containing protein n=1 Tax=Scleropages formosus TaxID=113540 RepID=A0A8C9S1H5_SCLFO